MCIGYFTIPSILSHYHNDIHTWWLDKGQFIVIDERSMLVLNPNEIRRLTIWPN